MVCFDNACEKHAIKKIKTIQPQFEKTRKNEKKNTGEAERLLSIPISWPLARSKLKGIQASVSVAGMVLAVSPAHWPKLKGTI